MKFLCYLLFMFCSFSCNAQHTDVWEQKFLNENINNIDYYYKADILVKLYFGNNDIKSLYRIDLICSSIDEICETQIFNNFNFIKYTSTKNYEIVIFKIENDKFIIIKERIGFYSLIIINSEGSYKFTPEGIRI